MHTPIRLRARSGWGVPAVDDDAVYYLSKTHELICVERVGGGTRWTQMLGVDATPTAGSVVSLAGSLVVAGDFDVYAFDRTTGTKRWHFSPDVGHGLGHYLGDTSGPLVLAGSPSARAYAVDPLTGALRWMSDPIAERATVFPPVLSDRGVVAGYTDYSTAPRSGGVVMLDSETGKERWRTPFPRPSSAASSFAGGPIVMAGLVFAAASDGTVHALDLPTGAIRWTLPSVLLDGDPSGAAPPGEDYRAMTGQGHTLVVGSVTGILTAIDVDTRRERWKYLSPADGSIAFGIRSDRRAVYVPHLSGRLIAVSIATGHELWRAGGRDSPFFWPPAVGRDRLHLTTEAGLYAIPF